MEHIDVSKLPRKVVEHVNKLYEIIALKDNEIGCLKNIIEMNSSGAQPGEKYVTVDLHGKDPLIFPDYAKVTFHVDEKRALQAYLEIDNLWQDGWINIHGGARTIALHPVSRNWLGVTIEER